ncbi:transporter substrate-binding domain-containing protein [Rhizobium sp. RAF56]|uniref:transporter substrate-binding domain-containing protein n=1 Tax=Rhizobium sp. RAF56 TaxID=3233062 RepID=UPI003F9B2801
MRVFLPIVMAVLWFGLSLSTANSSDVKIGLAAEPYPPFTYPDANGQWIGWEVDIADELCAQAKLNCKLVAVAWDGIIPALTTGKIDMIVASMAITAERKKVIDFSNKYYDMPAVVVGQKDEKIIPTPEGLKDKIVGTQSATIHEEYVRKHFGSAIHQLKSYQTQDEVNQDLSAGRIDAMQMDAGAADAFLGTEIGKNCCELKGKVADDPDILGLGVGAGFRKSDTELKLKINDALAAILKNGRYYEITKKYFNFDIYGSR